eukprot:4235311-Pyramimonas_sp.AAC.1
MVRWAGRGCGRFVRVAAAPLDFFLCGVAGRALQDVFDCDVVPFGAGGGRVLLHFELRAERQRHPEQA